MTTRSVDIGAPMNEDRPTPADSARTNALAAVVDLFAKLKLDFAFVGDVALSALTGSAVEGKAIDLLALVSPDRAQQIPVMAGNRGFEVDRVRIEAAAELDLIPLRFDGVPVHILLASNSLYAKMIPTAVDAEIFGISIRVVAPDDLALLLLMSESDETDAALRNLIDSAGSSFDIDRFNQRLVSIGLRGKMIAR